MSGPSQSQCTAGHSAPSSTRASQSALEISPDDRCRINETVSPLLRSALSSSATTLTSDKVIEEVEDFLNVISIIRTNPLKRQSGPVASSDLRTWINRVNNAIRDLRLPEASAVAGNIAALIPGGSTLSAWLNLASSALTLFLNLSEVGEYAECSVTAVQELMDALDVALDVIQLHFVEIGSPSKFVAEVIVLYLSDIKDFCTKLCDAFPGPVTTKLRGKRWGFFKRAYAIGNFKPSDINDLRWGLCNARMRLFGFLLPEAIAKQYRITEHIKDLQNIAKMYQSSGRDAAALENRIVLRNLSIRPIPDYVLCELDEEHSIQARLLKWLLRRHSQTLEGSQAMRREEPFVSVVHGMGGMGKSTLCAVCADWLKTTVEGNERFPHGVFWIQASKSWTMREVVMAMRDIITAFSDKMVDKTEVDKSRVRNMLAAVLAGKSVLLVLDDIWDSALAKEFIIALRDANDKILMNDVAILLSTRTYGMSDLARPEGRFKMEEMTRKVARRVLDKVSRREGVDVDLIDCAGLESILTRAGGLPLGLRIAGSMVKEHGISRTIRAFSAGIEHVSSDLVAAELGNDYSSLVACFNASIDALLKYSRLNDKQRVCTLYKAFAVIKPESRVPMKTLAHMWNESEANAELAVTELRKYGLLETRNSPDRVLEVFMHDLLFSFAKSMANDHVDVHRTILGNCAQGLNLQYVEGQGYVLGRVREWWHAHDHFLVDNLCTWLAKADLVQELLALITDFRYIQLRVSQNDMGYLNIERDCFAVKAKKWQLEVDDLIRAIFLTEPDDIALRLVGWVGFHRLQNIPPESRTLAEAAAWSASLHIENSSLIPCLAIPRQRTLGRVPIMTFLCSHQGWDEKGGDVVWLERTQCLVSIMNYGNINVCDMKSVRTGPTWDMSTRSVRAELAVVPGDGTAVVAAAGSTLSLLRFWTDPSDEHTEKSPEAFCTKQRRLSEDILKICVLPSGSHAVAAVAEGLGFQMEVIGFEKIVVKMFNLARSDQLEDRAGDTLMSITGASLFPNVPGFVQVLLHVFSLCAILERVDRKRRCTQKHTYVCMGTNAFWKTNEKPTQDKGQYMVLLRVQSAEIDGNREHEPLKVIQLNSPRVECVADGGSNLSGRLLLGGQDGIRMLDVMTESIVRISNAGLDNGAYRMAWLPHRSRLYVLTGVGDVRVMRVRPNGRMSWQKDYRMTVTVPPVAVTSFAVIGDTDRVVVMDRKCASVYGPNLDVNNDEYMLHWYEGERVCSVVPLEGEGEGTCFLSVSIFQDSRIIRVWDATKSGVPLSQRSWTFARDGLKEGCVPVAWIRKPGHVIVGERTGNLLVLSATLDEEEAIKTGFHGDVDWVVAVNESMFVCAMNAALRVEVWRIDKEYQQERIISTGLFAPVRDIFPCGGGSLVGIVLKCSVRFWDVWTGEEKIKMERSGFLCGCEVKKDVVALVKGQARGVDALHLTDGGVFFAGAAFWGDAGCCACVPGKDRIIIGGRPIIEVLQLERLTRNMSGTTRTGGSASSPAAVWKEVGHAYTGGTVTSLCSWKDDADVCRVIVGHEDGSLVSLQWRPRSTFWP